MLHDIIELYKHPNDSEPNLTREDHEAISALKQRRDIIIKPAHKGGKIVLWPVNQYLEEAHRQLSDSKYYQHQTSNHIHKLAAQITTFLTHLYAKMLQAKTSSSIFYHKVQYLHHCSICSKNIHKPNIPGRPIISGCDLPTERISKYPDHYLQPIIPTLPSYTKDTNHFLKTIFDIKDKTPHNAILVALDVVSLHTIINQNKGIESCLEALNLYHGNSLPISFHLVIWRNHHRSENQVTWCSVKWPNILLLPCYTFSEQQPKAIEDKVCLHQSWSLCTEWWKVQNMFGS